MKKIRIIATFLLVIAITILLGACSDQTSGDNSALDEIPPLSRTPDNLTSAMPLSVESDGAGRPTVERLGWQSIFETPREGFTLVPLEFSANGVNVASAFVLTVPDDLPPGYMPEISIEGQPLPTVRRQADGGFLVSPVVPLFHNSLYIFSLARDDAAELTWAFQTASLFRIVSTLPGHEATNVPVNTGIEITFSSGGHSDIREHFSISPAVDGRFIQRGATTIFMPTNPLRNGQLYRVTISSGIRLNDSTEVISEDYVFSFETAATESQNQQQASESFYFATGYTEYPSFEPPAISFGLNYPWRGTRPVVNIDVYRFDDTAQAVEAVQNLMSVPRWAWFTWQQSMVNVSELASVTSLVITEPQEQDEWGWQERFQLPNALPPGFYIVNASLNNEVSDQMIIQVTDLAVQLFADDNMTLVWVNDMVSGRAASGAQVRDSQRSGHTDGNGIVSLRGAMTDADDILIVNSSDGKRCIIFYARHVSPAPLYWGWNMPSPSANYWTALQLDRTLFQRSDTLYFWGFAQNRESNEDISFVSAVLTEGWGFGRFGARDTLHRQSVPVRGGAYSDSIALPHLNPGSYNLTIYHGDIVLGSMFFEVQDYVKPPYQMLVSADRRAAFIGEAVTFTARTEFFEGTPVPDLSISYNLWGAMLQHETGGQTGVTNSDGNFDFSIARLLPAASAQGQTTLYFNAEATLPEIGRTMQSATLQVFVNDIDVQVRASREGQDSALTVSVNSITLDRLNDGTAEHGGDFLDRPVSGQNLSVEIVSVTWVPVRIGERYCFIERVVVPRYRYDRRVNVIQRFSLTTDANGEAKREFTVPNNENESYFARVTTTDGNGRRILHESFIGRDWWNFFLSAESGELFLDGAREWSEGYDIGDEVNLTVRRGTDIVTLGEVLFVVASNGIIEYRIGTNPLIFTFGEEHIPNATVYAVHFNGHTYSSGWQMRQTLRFNSLSRELVLSVTTDQDEYSPGDTAVVTVRATNKNGVPMQANINIAAVDEALFALQDYQLDTRFALYRIIPSGVRHNVMTHRTFQSDGHAEHVYARAESVSAPQNALSADAAAEPEEDAASGGGSGSDLREIFRDTAVFASLQTDNRGVATFSFRLPDNITSWRLSVSGITNNLYAGNDSSNIIVTNPMFVHYSLNDVFLVGDTPVLGVNAYGTAFSGGERVQFEVWDDAAPDNILRAQGAAFERVNIPLWEMREEGAHSIIIRAVSDSGLSDSVRHNFYVMNSHRLVDTAVFYDVTPNTTFAAGSPGLTQITFSDQGRGQFLGELMGMRWVRGARIESLIMRREANRLINEHFPDLSLYAGGDSFDPSVYQRSDGGISMLPHSESDLNVTVRVLPFILDDISVPALRNYLYEIFDNSSSENKMLALYGLALLREPVLLDLHGYLMLQDLHVRDVAYIALSLDALGETHLARALYNERILPHIQEIAPYYRVNLGTTRAEILDTTAVVALLASQLNAPERTGLHQYVVQNHTWDLLVSIQRLSFIVNEIENVNEHPAGITYRLFGEEVTRDLSYGRSFTLRIPTQNLQAFNMVSVVGDVGAVSIHRIPLEDIEVVDAELSITRQFFRAGENTARTTFDHGDLVRVQITVTYSNTAPTGSYQITDFLPAGLVLAPGSTRFGDMNTTPGHWRFASAEGQRVTFFDFNFPRNHQRTNFSYYYYARVVNPGVFRAEGVLVQNLGARDYIAVGTDSSITILG